MEVRNLRGPVLSSTGNSNKVEQKVEKQMGKEKRREQLTKKELPGSFGIADRLYSIIDRYLTDLKCP